LVIMNGQQELNDALQRVVRPSQNYYDEILAWSKTMMPAFNALKTFTSEDVSFLFKRSKGLSPAEPRVYGAVIKALQSEGKIRHVGYTKATNKQAHCRPISVWQVV
jgi:hypothetical protein